MATSSTKRNRKKAQAARSAASSGAAKRETPGAEKRRKQDAPPPPESRPEMSERAWLVARAVVLLLATVLRVVALGMKPLHHDEGVNGFFLTNLMRQGRYAYDPANYHGPTLYYLTLPVAYLADTLHLLNTWVLRSVPVLFGIGTVWLVLTLSRRVGRVAALTSAALVAVSPACVFYSRYFIHEMPFVFFTLGIVVAVLRFQETGASHYLLLAAGSAAMLFATKETAFISVGTLGLAWLSAFVWEKLVGGGRGSRNARTRRGEEVGGFANFRASGQATAAIVAAVALFVFVWIAFYSSFFTNWKGVFWDSFKAFDIWKETGMSEFHSKPANTYIKWLVKEDAPILVLGCLGTLVALFERRKNRFAIFAAAWGLGLLAAYSLISYKTPWLVLNFVVPLALVGGYAVQALYDWGRAEKWVRMTGHVPALVVAALALGLSLYQTFVINFREYDNDQYPYVYSQTQRQVFGLIDEVEQMGARAGTNEPGIAMASPDYWPLPWYFRDNSHAGFEGHLSTFYDTKSTLAVIGKEEQLPQLQRVVGDDYVRVGEIYPLRPGVNLVLFERRDLAPK